jgi:excisionase family DNA binding protein
MESTNLTMSLTPEMVAAETHLHVNTVYRLLKTNKLPHIKLSRVYLISRVEFEKWLAGHSNGPPASGVV